MRGAGKRLVAAAAAATVLLVAGPALAFHAGNLFDTQPGGGGGGGLFYTGSPREHGWTCAACHIEAPLLARVSVASDPPELMAERRYLPGQSYRLTFKLLNESRGLASPLSNYNSIVLTALDPGRRAAGSFSGYAASEYYARGTAILASAGRTPNEIEWSFDWTAPAASTGHVGLYVAVVDGNGANSTATTTLTDPFGDDLALGQFSFGEGGTTPAAVSPAPSSFGGEGAEPPRAAPGPQRSPWLRASLLLAALASVLLLVLTRRARRRLAVAGALEPGA